MSPVDELDAVIGRALNEPLGDESPPSWEALVESATRTAAFRREAPRAARFGSRRRVIVRLVVAVAVAAAVAGALLLLPGRQTSLLDAAAAALPENGPVLHLVGSFGSSGTVSGPLTATTLDLRTGATTTRRVVNPRVEMWFDRERGIFKEISDQGPLGRVVIWANKKRAISPFGQVRLPGLGSAAAARSTIPVEVTLFSHYKQALRNHDAQFDGDGTINGQPVYFLLIRNTEPVYSQGRSRPPTSYTVIQSGKIAISKKTNLPVAVFAIGRSHPSYYIHSVALIPRAQANLAMPSNRLAPAVDAYGFPATRNSHVIPTEKIASWLGNHPLTTPRVLAGQQFAVARATDLNPARHPVRHGVELIYGSTCANKPRYDSTFVVVQAAQTPEIAYGTQHPLAHPASAKTLLLTHGHNAFATCATPKIAFFSGQPKKQALWIIPFRIHGLYVSISSPQKSLAIAATRQLLQ